MMFLFPKKSKFTKSFSAKKLTAKTVTKVKPNKYGNISLIANETGKITNFQMESIRRFLRRTFSSFIHFIQISRKEEVQTFLCG